MKHQNEGVLDAESVERALEFVDHGLRHGAAAVLLTDESKRQAIERGLQRRHGPEIVQRLFHAEPTGMLDAITTDGIPDELAFSMAIQPLVRRARQAGDGNVRMVSELLDLVRGAPAEFRNEVAYLWDNFARRNRSIDILALPLAT